MKKSIFKFISFCLLSIFALFAFACFAEEIPMSQKIKESIRKVAMEYVIFEKNAFTEIVSSNNEFSWDKTLFVGDSLLEGLNNANDIEELGATVDSKVGRPISKGKEVLQKYSNYDTVVIILGTNDCGNSAKTFKKYLLNAINTAKSNNPNANIFINTMPPIDDIKAKNNGYKARNYMVENNNKTIIETAAEENVNIINSYEFLINNNYKTRDGIHMQKETYELWFEWLKDKIDI